MTDEYSGQGGSYTIDDFGKRELVERTREPDEAPPPTLTEVIPPEQPADAGIFSPVAPADQPTTTE